MGSKVSGEEAAWAGLSSLWAQTVGEPEICIAVLDGPIDRTHPCFEGAQLSQVETLASGVVQEGAASRHGTHVASVIFGQHGSTVRGIAPGCRGLIVPVFAEGVDGSIMASSQLDLARAITQALDHGAHVINISGGELVPSGEPEPFLAQAIQRCLNENVLIVAAAGNNGCECLHVPAAAPSVLAVGAMDEQGKPLGFSNWGSAYQAQGILAPGEKILGAMPSGETARQSGTSFATPVVSGIVALLLSLQVANGSRPDPAAVRAALLESAHPCNPQEASDCSRFLVGTLNIAGAYERITVRQEEAQKKLAANEVENLDQEAAGGAFSASVVEPIKMVAQEDVTPSGAIKRQDAEHVPPMAEFNEPKEEKKDALSNQKENTTMSTVASVPQASALWGSVFPSQVEAAGCGGGPPALGYVLGAVGYDFGNEARRDSFVQAGLQHPSIADEVLDYLNGAPYEASRVTWTLNIGATPVYAIQPAGAFADVTYGRLREFLNAQINEGVQRVSIPGFVGGKVQLMSGQTVPAIVPVLRGMYSWSTPALVEAVLGKAPSGEEKIEQYLQRKAGVHNFLERVYYELRNLGVTSQERAINFAATNAFQVEQVYEQAINHNLHLDRIEVEKSPICRPGSDCWDVKLTFFDPENRQARARGVYRFTVDVSDVIPVTVGQVRVFKIY